MTDFLVVGSARCVWDDVRGLPEPVRVMCVNDIGMHWPGPVKHWYSNNHDMLLRWSAARRRLYRKLFGEDWTLHSGMHLEHHQGIRYWDDLPGQGGSGLWAIVLACRLYDGPITVAGMPFDDSGHYYDPPENHNLRKDRRWSHFSNETPDRAIKELLPLFRGRVTALSGRLKEALG